MAFGLFKENTKKSHNKLFIITCLGVQMLLNSPAMAATGNVKNPRMTQATGKVKFFNAHKGYGFVQPDDGGKDVFVHFTAVNAAGMRDLKAGKKISYKLQEGKKGFNAVDLKDN